jgi:hypothetical protein
MEQDLNHIKLTAGMIAGLYKDQLVEEQAQIVPVDPVKKANGTFKYLGENKKNILVLTDYNDVVFLPDEHLAFLTTILNACKISLGDVAIINIAQTETDYRELKIQLNQQKALLFNVEPAQIQLPVSFPTFQVQSFDGCQYLLSPSLNTLENDKALKGKLWTSLQRLFLS